MSAFGATRGLPDPLPEYLEASARAAIAAVEAGDLAEARRLWTVALEAIPAAPLHAVGGRKWRAGQNGRDRYIRKLTGAAPGRHRQGQVGSTRAVETQR